MTAPARLPADARSLLTAVVPKPARKALWQASGTLGELEQRVFERRLDVSTSGDDAEGSSATS